MWYVPGMHTIVVKRKCTVAFVEVLTMLYIVHRYTQKFISFNQLNLFSFSITAPHPKLLLAHGWGLLIATELSEKYNR